MTRKFERITLTLAGFGGIAVACNLFLGWTIYSSGVGGTVATLGVIAMLSGMALSALGVWELLRRGRRK
jgi:hypothetical protein